MMNQKEIEELYYRYTGELMSMRVRLMDVTTEAEEAMLRDEIAYKNTEVVLLWRILGMPQKKNEVMIMDSFNDSTILYKFEE